MMLLTRPPGAWIDTNVMLEIYSFMDIAAAANLANDLARDAERERRRIRMRGSLWLAMVLVAQEAVTLTYSHEGLRHITNRSGPGTELGVWTHAILFVLCEGGVFDGWSQPTTDRGAELSNHQRDQLMVEMCRKGDMTLVTRDREAALYAGTQAVRAVTPEDYASDLMPPGLAREMFMSRIRTAISRFVALGTPEQRERRSSQMAGLLRVYNYVWPA